MTTFPSFCSYSDGKDNETAKGYHRKNETGKVDISALIVAPNDATGNTTSVDDIIVPQDDSWSVSKEESSRNEAVEDDWMDMKPGNVETMGSERSDLFTPMIEHASQHIGNDQLLFVPQVHIQQASESDTSSNVCPFAYNGGIRVSCCLTIDSIPSGGYTIYGLTTMLVFYCVDLFQTNH